MLLWYPTRFTGAGCGGEGTDGSVCWIDPGSVQVLHILSFSALNYQCTPKGQCVSLCLGLKGHQTTDLSCSTSAVCLAPLWVLDKECKRVGFTHAERRANV